MPRAKLGPQLSDAERRRSEGGSKDPRTFSSTEMNQGVSTMVLMLITLGVRMQSIGKSRFRIFTSVFNAVFYE